MKRREATADRTPRTQSSGLSGWLRRWAGGDASASAQLTPQVYALLRRMAARELRRERSDHTLQPTALVHELFLKLAGSEVIAWQDRNHFFAVAAQAMRRILVDHARKRRAAKRGAGKSLLSLDEIDEPGTTGDPETVLAIDDALARLEQLDSQQAKVVELIVFSGLTGEEIAKVLMISTATVQREWRSAKAWLRRELATSAESP